MHVNYTNTTPNPSQHTPPSHISPTVLREYGTRLPPKFLRGCGLTPWEVESVKLHDPNLSPQEIADLQTQIFALRTDNPIQLRPIFISYNRERLEERWSTSQVHGRPHR